jgi:hypothetical protein
MSTSAKNKRERIIELISNGNDNAQEIAQIVGTTPANVWKEKSKLRRRSGLLLGRRTVELSSKKTKDEMLILSADDRQKPDTNHYQHLSIPALDMEGMKKLYTDFKMGKKPIDIIAEHGFHPDVVEKEYRRFLNFNERDMDSLQKTYISSIIKYPIPDAEPLFKKYQINGNLTNNEFIELLKIKSDYDKSRAAVYSLITDKDFVLPDPFIKMNCVSCEQLISDIIMNINTENGRLIFESFGNLLYCDSCRPDAQ